MTTIEKIRSVIQKVLDTQRDFTSENAKAEASALNWVLELFDKYAGEPCEDAKSKKEIAKIVDELYENANEDQQWILCELYRKIIHLPNVQPKQEPKDEWQNGYDMAWEEAKVFYEQEPCEDAISREQAKQAIRNKFKTLAERCEINEVLNSLPSVQPKQKTGRWIKYGKLYQCSECKEFSCCQGKFCNDCGARMVEAQESEEV